ncbi:glycosyl transferase group 1 [Rippkaea orientalis PCC 8801]|uniref:Glycosyl transferase group 1 n=1 Tax=Rippkaea orientalis (strain PCC 8801 / RF-1) TaxID=41431 RepID=B7JUX1_RIPO1|nr:glycosyltransferase family 4 protein [Rippkaea orientalis]ACK66823.1 glycosyl transferase group 1 [Rippkaea orientalis PCC 8801]
MLKLLFISTPVGSLGSGIGGGVELTLKNLAIEMNRRGHQVTVLAPESSILPNIDLIQIAGQCQQMAQAERRRNSIALLHNSVLGNMWDYARTIQYNYDIITNFAYDWLPFYLTPFFKRPIAHLVSMSSINPAFDQIITQVAQNFPKTIGVHSKIQAETFPFAASCRILGNGLDLSLYQCCLDPGESLGWVGRIAPEKGLEDAVAAAQITGIPLKIFGKMEDKSYWQQISQDYPHAPVDYQGFLSTFELQEQLGRCRALLMTPRWVEAFGNVVMEALACGVPIIAYRRGGPAEMVREGETGFLVEPDNITALVANIERIDTISRHRCRQQAEQEYSLNAFGDRFEKWFIELKK